MKKIILDEYEQEIVDSFEQQKPVENKEAFFVELQKAAAEHVKKRRPITLRIPPQDIEAMKIKASKVGIPYQTYISMLIHKDASKL